MAGKIGEEFFKDMVDRGRREIGGLFFHDSNIAQPNYPFRGGYSIGKEIEALSDHEPRSARRWSRWVTSGKRRNGMTAIWTENDRDNCGSA